MYFIKTLVFGAVGGLFVGVGMSLLDLFLYMKPDKNLKKRGEVMLDVKNEMKHIECDALQISDLEKLYETGWRIYDTKPDCNTEDIKILTMVKG